MQKGYAPRGEYLFLHSQIIFRANLICAVLRYDAQISVPCYDESSKNVKLLSIAANHRKKRRTDKYVE
jgi:hypothetical protein